MKYIAMILAWLTPLLAALKYIGGFNISWPVILAPITPLFGFALLVWVVAIGAVLLRADWVNRQWHKENGRAPA